MNANRSYRKSKAEELLATLGRGVIVPGEWNAEGSVYRMDKSVRIRVLKCDNALHRGRRFDIKSVNASTMTGRMVQYRNLYDIAVAGTSFKLE